MRMRENRTRKRLFQLWHFKFVNNSPETQAQIGEAFLSARSGKFALVAALFLVFGWALWRNASGVAEGVWSRLFFAAEQQRLSASLGRAKSALTIKSAGGNRVFARRVSAREAADLSQRVGAQIQLQRADPVTLPADFRAAQTVFRAGNAWYFAPAARADSAASKRAALAGYALLRGARGVPDHILRVQQPRSGLQKTIRVLETLGWASAAIGALLLCSIAPSLWPRLQSAWRNRPRLFAASVEAAPQTASQTAENLAHEDDAQRVRDELESVRVRLKESEETYRQMALNASDVLYAMHPEAGRIEWLGQIDLMLGYAHGSFPRTIEAWADSIHPDEAENIIALYTGACEQGEEFTVEYRMRHRNGSYRDWSHRGKPLYDNNKKLLKLVGACTDITEKKRAENRLRESEERLARIVETVADAIIMVDAESVITFANPASELVFGADRKDIIG